VIRTVQTRLYLAERLARRDHLHGAWWPHTTDIEQELFPMLAIIGGRFRSVAGVLLNQREWPQTAPGWQPRQGSKPKVSWYGAEEPHTAVLRCGDLSRIVLLVLAPDTPESVALSATFMACTPGNSLTAAQTLARAQLS
jgi:hypothetical protein